MLIKFHLDCKLYLSCTSIFQYIHVRTYDYFYDLIHWIKQGKGNQELRYPRTKNQFLFPRNQRSIFYEIGSMYLYDTCPECSFIAAICHPFPLYKPTQIFCKILLVPWVFLMCESEWKKFIIEWRVCERVCVLPCYINTQIYTHTTKNLVCISIYLQPNLLLFKYI